MKIIVFGASGGTGTEIVKQALAAGYNVTAFVRNPVKIELIHPNLRIFQGDAQNAVEVERAISGQHAVISALGPTRPPVPGMMANAAQNIVAAMKKHKISRLVSTTGAGVRDAQDQPKLIDHLMKGLLTLIAGEVLRDSATNVSIIQESGLDWTIVRFPRLIDGQHTGKYRVGYVGRNSGSQLSRADGADFVLKEMLGSKYLHKMPVVSY